MCNCHSILECCVMFSGVKLTIRSFSLFLELFGVITLNIGKVANNFYLLQRIFRQSVAHFSESTVCPSTPPQSGQGVDEKHLG